MVEFTLVRGDDGTQPVDLTGLGAGHGVQPSVRLRIASKRGHA